jgi:hypothetical protein
MKSAEAFSIGNFDGLWHRIWILPAVLHRLEAKAGSIHAGVLGRFSGVISSNLWVSFIRRLSSVSVAPNVCLSPLNQPPERGRGSTPA